MFFTNHKIVRLRFFLSFLILFHYSPFLFADNAQTLIEKGWKALVKDNDTDALNYFSQAYEKALIEKDTLHIASSLLHLGICSYSISYSEGLEYCFKAMSEYKKFEKTDPEKALEGRSRCLQLISTINARQGKYREAISLSTEAMAGFAKENDTTGYLGLIYNSLGNAYGKLNLSDSSAYFHRLALKERLLTKNVTYLPGSYISVGTIELKLGNKDQSRALYDRALIISDSTGNRQAQVNALLSLGNWFLLFEKNEKEAESYFQKAQTIASGLTDKSFYLLTLDELINLRKQQNDFRQALFFEQEKVAIRDTLYSWDKQKAIRSLEVQFDVSEKNRQLTLIQRENYIASLTNYLLWGTLLSLAAISIGIILFLRRINKRDKLLLQTKEALVYAIEEQKKLKEQQMQNELEFKESQLSALTLQMLQKNELMQELKERLEEDKNISKDNAVSKIISKSQNQDKDWTDFNSHFESLNKNFYSRLKQAYPDINPNDLKICALIKLNLSIKEMAGILNISPDSVKTARYRLRKKLQLNTEDNLTDFIMNL